MNYLSLCSGIEAASVGFPQSWEPVAFSEIDAFPSAVLEHRFPNVPNWGDMTKFQEWPDVSIDLICGGTPCQSFSVAGLRKGLDDPRGNLMLTFGHILGKYRPTWFVWENVPGVLSSDAGRDFASFLELVTGQIVAPPKDDSGWRNAGAISGIDSAYGCAWRVLDAQYTRSPKYPRAVPQRRRRVFVVGHLGDWRRAAAVLLDSESLSRDPSPRREAGQRVAGTLKGGSGERGYPDPSDGNGGGLIEVRSGSHWDGGANAHPTLSQALRSSGGIAMSDQELFAQRGAGLVAHTLRGEGFDASEDGCGRGTLIVPTAWPAEVAPTLNAHFGDKQGLEDQHALNGAGLFVPVATARESGQGYWMESDVAGTIDANTGMSGHKERPGIVAIRTAQTSANGHGIAEDVAHTIDQAQGQAVAFTCKDSGGDLGEVSPTLRSMNFDASHANGGGQVAVMHQMAVRRLLPVETERLQGFADGHTDVPYRNKPTSPDGPRYKAIGNSMATNCMEWIGIRIQQVADLD